MNMMIFATPTEMPPVDSVVRVTPFFSAPEFVKDKVTCCPTHMQEQQERGDCTFLEGKPTLKFTVAGVYMIQ